MASRVGHIALGWIRDRRGEWKGEHADDLLGDFELGREIGRHRRTWIMGPYSREQNGLWARVGFQSSTDENEIWDAVLRDFRPVESRRGASSPMFVNGQTGRLAFQIRPGIIDRAPFCRALERLLNKHHDGERIWSVTADLAPLDWDSWVTQASRITRLSFTIEEPNPSWRGREQIGNIVDGANAHMMRMVLEADDGAKGLNIDDEFVAQAIEHTVRRGYGKVVAEADESTNRRFDSSQREAPPEIRVTISDGKDVSPSSLEAASRRASMQASPPPESPNQASEEELDEADQS